jgi:hypothetical protein
MQEPFESCFFEPANQMLLFFELKQQLFGHDKLAKDITIHDLDEDNLEA